MRLSRLKILLLLVGAVLTAGALAAIGQEPFFPEGVFSEHPRLHKFIDTWYSKQLTALEEPSLLKRELSGTAQTYRFLWLRTFHQPVAIRIEVKADGGAELTVKVASGAGGYDPGKLVKNSTRQLTKKEATMFLDKIQATHFWDLPSVDRSPDKIGLDGSQWIVEGASSGKYHVVDRWTPGKGPVYEIGMAAIHLANLNLSKKEIY